MPDTTTAYNEKKLLNNLAGGSETAFQLLYERHWQKIYTVSILYLKDKNTAEDIVQEAFLRIWKKRAELPEINNFQHYIHTVARNLIISMLRKKMPVSHAALETSLGLQEDNWKPVEQLEAKEISALIKKAVNRLSPKQKQVYLLSSEKQLPLRELAVELNISYDTARQYKSEALKIIRCFLKENSCQIPFLVLLTIFF